jgi:ElaB/YqjD/DUF883 family membrane-anchored ribosome-binding protein
MLEGFETVVSEVQHLITELEKLLVASAGEVTAQTQEAVANCLNTLRSAQQRLEKLRLHTGRRVADVARTATRTLHDSPWTSVAIATTAGLLVGLLLGRQDDSRR